MLEQRGGHRHRRRPGTLTVSGLAAERVAALLSEHAVPFSEVSAHRATLEEAYMELTRDAVEYRAAAGPGSGDRVTPMTQRRDRHAAAPDRQAPGRAGFADAAARGVDQVPHRARLGDRHGRRGRWSSCWSAAVGRGQPHSPATAGRAAAAHPVGPGGEAVTDSFYFVRRPLAGNGSITARVTSLTGLSHGVGRPGPGRPGPAVGDAPGPRAVVQGRAHHQGEHPAGIGVRGDDGHRRPRGADAVRLHPGHRRPARRRLRRVPALAAADPAGDTVTGYDSADGTHWTLVGTATLPGLPSTVQAGLFATSPGLQRDDLPACSASAGPAGPPWPPPCSTTSACTAAGQAGAWTGTVIGGGPERRDPGPGGGYRQAGGAFTVTGSGDIAPDVPGGAGRRPDRLIETLMGTFVGLIAVVVVGTMFITAEYRRDLIRITFAASPQRGQVLAAKAIVIGSVTFAAALAAAVVAVPLGSRVLRDNGNYLYPVTALTEVRLVAGTAALLAVAAVLALAIGAVLRRSAIAVTVVIVAIVLPYLIAVTNLLPPAPASGCCGWPRPPPSRSSRPSRTTRR